MNSRAKRHKSIFQSCNLGRDSMTSPIKWDDANPWHGHFLAMLDTAAVQVAEHWLTPPIHDHYKNKVVVSIRIACVVSVCELRKESSHKVGTWVAPSCIALDVGKLESTAAEHLIGEQRAGAKGTFFINKVCSLSFFQKPEGIDHRRRKASEDIADTTTAVMLSR